MGLFGKKKTPEEKLDELYEKGMAAFNAGNHGRALELFEKAAEQGDAFSQYKCGMMYEKGIGTLMDEEKALYWYKKAAEQGNAEAQSAYEKLREIRSTLIDKLAQAEQAFFEGEYEEAISCYEWVLAHTDDYDLCDQAYEGFAQAKKRMKESEQFWQSVSSKTETPPEKPVNEMSAEDTYQKGMELYQAGDYTKALSLFEKAAEQGNIDAQYNCGEMYKKGTGTQRDGKKALYWCEKAAEQGHADAQYDCGFLYRYGYGAFGTGKDEKKAFYWFEKAAEQGNIYAQYDYGEMYEKGIGTEKDVKKAFCWYEKAAEQGHEVAQYNCGLMYESGCGTAVDTDKAFQWYEKAAKQGHTEAQEKIEAEGERCFFAEDYKKATFLLSIAVETGRQGAWYLLGRMYADGLGVQKDSARAKTLFDKLPPTSIGERYTIAFGTYPQGEHDETEPIRWYVLERRDDQILLLSTKVLDARAYHGSREPITWEKCDLRQWLNHAFMEKAFTEKEKNELIEEVRLENPDNTEYGTLGGSATTDKVFLLSMEETRKYLNIDADDEDDRDSKTMEGKYTPYAGKKIGEYECFGNAYWWLRSPGAKRETAADMEHNYGFLEDKGMNVDFPYCGIRPALWLKLKS